MDRPAVAPTELEALAQALGAGIVEASPAGWGDARATVRVSLTDGRLLAVRRSPGPDGQVAAGRWVAITRLLAAHGLPVICPEILTGAGMTWLVSPWHSGEVGAAWLDDPDRARVLGTAMGALVRRMRDIDAGEFETIGFQSGTARAASVFVHGDFAPVNVVLDGHGRVLALLDFEHAGLGSPLADATWWSWVVRHHHPEAWRVAWPSFREAADLDPAVVDGDSGRAVLHARLRERVMYAPSPADRARWQARLDEAVAWPA